MKSNTTFRCFLRCCGALLAASSLHAANITWSGATNTWNTASNWVGGVLPVSGDSLVFDAAGAGGVLLNNDLTSGSFTVPTITFGSAGTAGAYVIGNGTASANAGNTFVLANPAANSTMMQNSSGKLQTINTPLSMTGTDDSITGDADISLGGNISGAGAYIKSGSNTLSISGTNTHTGRVQINLGVLRLDSASAIPGGIGSTGGLCNISINGGVIGLAVGDFTRGLNNTATTVQFAGNGGWAAFGANRLVNLGGASASVTWATATTGLNAKNLILSHPTATHTVDFQNPLDMGTAARTVQVDNGAAAIDGIISGNITGGSGGNLTKSGDGTLALTGAANNYTGTTTVSAGTLLVNGTKSGTGAVTVNAGASLGGSGSISGAVTAAAGGRINLVNGAVANLALGTSLTLSGSAATPNQLFFDLGNGAGGTDKIIVTGAHTASTANGVLVHLNQISGANITPNIYTLIQGGAASTFTGYTLATARAGRNFYSSLGASGNDLQVTVAAGTPGDAITNHYWQGTTGTWNTDQWYSDPAGTTTATAPGYSSNVRFATTTASNLTSTLGEDYEINSLTVDAGIAATSISGNMLTIDATGDNGNTAGNGITVNNAAGTTIASKVGIAGSQTWTVGTGAALTVSGAVSDFGGGYSLTKAGTGTLTLTGANTLSGPLTVSDGTLAIGGAAQLNGGLHGANIVNNGTLSYASSANQTLNGIISGTGSLSKSGGSTLTLNNSGTFTGGATISGGTLAMAANLINPLGTGTTTVSTGGTYALGATLVTAPVILNGGTVTAGNSFTSFFNGPVTLNATSTISVSGNLTINGNISGTGGLTKTSTAFVSINGSSNTYDGPTVISGGGLTFKSSIYGNDTSKWIPANISVANGASLVMNVGGTGEFTIAQAGLMFSQLGGAVNNNGLQAGSIFGVDTRTAGGSFTISDNLTDSSGPGGGSVGFRIVGNGTIGSSTVELTGNNTYSGPTVLDRHGLIKVASINSVATNVGLGTVHSSSSNMGAPTTVANGTIQLGTNVSFQGAGLIYTGNGETTDRVLNMGGGGGETYRLDQSGSNLLKFTSNMTMTDTRGTKTIVLQGSTTGTGEMAGVIPNATTGSGTAVTKSGTGTWTLSAANAYLGVTTVNGGALVLANANALNGGIGATGGLGALTFNGGVIGLGAGDFSRPLTAANTVGGVNFTGNGGWAAYGANRVVNLGGASASVTWATANTGLNAKTLILGNATATHTVDFQNPLDMGSAARTVQVDDGSAAIDGKLSGILSGTAGGLIKTGAGTLSLTAANTYAGTTTVSAGKLLLGANNVLPDTANVSLGAATLDADTRTETTGTLNVTAAATINLGTGAAVAFANSSAVNSGTWAGTLNITGTFVSGSSLRFGTDNTGLTAGQLAAISVNGSGAGTYTLNSSGYLVAPSGYSSWQSANSTAGDLNADHDNDGVSNGVEFFLGGDTNTTGFTQLPAIVNTGGTLTITWTRHPNYPGFPGNYGTDFVVETSDTLANGSWSNAAQGAGADKVVISGNNVTYTFPAGSKKFARLRVTGP